MNCNRFRRDLPDWLRGGLMEIEIEKMAAHSATCRACAREEAFERHLRSTWKALPETPPAPEFWPRVAAALDNQRQAPRLGWRPARWAAASVFAAGALCAVILANRPAMETPYSLAAVDVNEQKVIQMVTELRQLPDFESERMAMDPPHLRNRAILLGVSEEK